MMGILKWLFKSSSPKTVPSHKRSLPSTPPQRPSLIFSERSTWMKGRPLAQQIIDVTAWSVYHLHSLNPDTIMMFGEVFKKTPFYNPKNTTIERENSYGVFIYALSELISERDSDNEMYRKASLASSNITSFIHYCLEELIYGDFLTLVNQGIFPWGSAGNGRPISIK